MPVCLYTIHLQRLVNSYSAIVGWPSLPLRGDSEVAEGKTIVANFEGTIMEFFKVTLKITGLNRLTPYVLTWRIW
jgi:hypothetical protein